MAANQARRRTDLDSVPTIDSGSQNPKIFNYEPLDLDPDADSIRLVLIEPSTNHDDPLACRLIHVKFAEKQSYKALSYMWGSNKMPLWVDAIYINQNDIPERNRQLEMMKWIYFRADTVVIWLGKKYLRCQMRTEVQTDQDIVPQGVDQEESQKSATALETIAEPGEPSTTISLGVSKEGGVEVTDKEREMVMALCADGYWGRLWIIQEFGRARRIEVCFGSLAMDWNAFIEIATLHNSSCEGTLRLNRLLQEKYSGSRTLRKLLQDHREALCKEPRDKIYGLVGLATDAIGFPMDYRKSLIEIWKDTMEFMNRRGLLPEADVITFGKFVKSLIGANLGYLEQTLQPYEPRPNSAPTLEDPDSPRVFQLRAYVVGCIMAVGPSSAEMISSLQKADKWAAEIQENFREELGEAHCENDKLMNTILESDESRLASTCFSHVSNLRWGWKDDWLYTRDIQNYLKTIQEQNSKCSVSLQSRSQISHNDTLLAGNSHLFLIKNCFRRTTPWKMGIASGLAQPGDLVCWVHGVERALILRVTVAERVSQVFGTALFTDDIDLKDKTRHASRLSSIHTEEILAVKMDTATIYVLLA